MKGDTDTQGEVDHDKWLEKVTIALMKRMYLELNNTNKGVEE